MRRSFPLLVLLVTFLSLLPSFVIASDYASCSESGYKYRFRGYATSSWSGHRWGIRSVLDYQGLHQCSSPRTGEGSSSLAWVGLEGPEGPQGNNVVQLGIGVCRSPTTACSTVTRDWWAWGREDCPGLADRIPTVTFLSTLSGGTSYSVSLHDGAYHLTTGSGVHIDVGTGQVCWSPVDATATTESWDFGDALGGSTVNRMDFGSLAFQTTESGAWQSLSPSSCNIQAPEAVFKCVGLGTGHEIQVWTDR